jgi:hypothetical protein
VDDEVAGGNLIIPDKHVVVSSIIQGIAGGDNAQQLKTVGMRVGIYFLVTTALAIAIGITIALIVQPGNYAGRYGHDHWCRQFFGNVLFCCECGRGCYHQCFV